MDTEAFSSISSPPEKRTLSVPHASLGPHLNRNPKAARQFAEAHRGRLYEGIASVDLGLRSEELELHFVGMPLRYWPRVDAATLRWHLDIIHEFIDGLARSDVMLAPPGGSLAALAGSGIFRSGRLHVGPSGITGEVRGIIRGGGTEHRARGHLHAGGQRRARRVPGLRRAGPSRPGHLAVEADGAFADGRPQPEWQRRHWRCAPGCSTPASRPQRTSPGAPPGPWW